MIAVEQGARAADFLRTVIVILFACSGVAAFFWAVAHMVSNGRDIQVSGTVRHEGTIRHEGTVRHEYGGTVDHRHTHTHSLDERSQALLERMQAQRELDDAVELHRIQSTQWSVPIEQGRRALEAGDDGVFR
jgi:hypothetical protein